MKKHQTRILFLASDPSNLSRLRIGQEIRDILESLSLAKLRDKFDLIERMSVRPSDITQAIFDTDPKILHFSGHGNTKGELCFEDENGHSQNITPEALASLFELLSEQVECVILNACFSEVQAQAISQYIDYVIGMNNSIGDKAAIAFSSGFYKALGAGRTIEESYKFGLVELKLLNIPEDLTPVIFRNKNITLSHFSKKAKVRKVEEDLYIVEQRHYVGYIAFSLHSPDNSSEDLRIYINPQSYANMQLLLDDIFINYLSHLVLPFSYGKQWVIVGRPSDQIIVPHAWVQKPFSSVHDIAREWGELSTLSKNGIEEDSGWMIELIGNQNSRLKPSDTFYAVVMTNEEIEKVLLSSPKAIYRFWRDGALKTVITIPPELDNRSRIFVFRNWLNFLDLNGKILISREKG